jgi:hypothetical protein
MGRGRGEGCCSKFRDWVTSHTISACGGRKTPRLQNFDCDDDAFQSQSHVLHSIVYLRSFKKELNRPLRISSRERQTGTSSTAAAFFISGPSSGIPRQWVVGGVSRVLKHSFFGFAAVLLTATGARRQGKPPVLPTRRLRVLYPR